MGIEIVFGRGLGDLSQSAEATVLAYRANEHLPEYSLPIFAAALRDLLAGMAQDCTEYVLAPTGARFYFLLVVKRPTLGLEVSQSVHFFVDRVRNVPIREQMTTAAARIACQLVDLGAPRWIAADAPRVQTRPMDTGLLN